MPGSAVACLRDADLDGEWPREKEHPQPWVERIAGGRTVQLGWLWSRTEIENYLIDPAVVAAALGSKAPEPAQYQRILERAADRLSTYTAARVALSTSRIPIKSLKNKWGKPRGGDRHPFPESLDRSSCRKHLKRIVRDCAQNVVPTENQVIGRFNALRRDFAKNGTRRSDYLHAYSGKDLLIQINEELPSIGFADFGGFREAILLGIASAHQDTAQWVPEWAELRRQVSSFAL